MHPVLFHIFGIEIRSYGFMAALGFLAAILTWIWIGRKERKPTEFATDLGLWLRLGGILGARLAYVAANWNFYSHEPLQILFIHQGGLIFYGGLILGALALVLFAKRKRIPVWHLADFAIPGLAIGHAFGRVGCFLNGCCFGRVAAHPACGVLYPPGSEPGQAFPNTPLYPVQLMEAGCLAVIWLILLLVYPRRKRDGTLFALYLLLYPVCRFFLEYLRGDDRRAWFVFDVAQAISIGLFACGLFLFAALPPRKFIPPAPTPKEVQ
ncbi:MAG: prolipoprotein diacylglyceryl transferase [Verrucomicrobiota bacterium]|nr:prolipoprotein diacylglyceryl transferase [Verrucomicrobiota bacterium]